MVYEFGQKRWVLFSTREEYDLKINAKWVKASDC